MFKKIFAPVTTKQCTEFGMVAIMVTTLLAIYFKQNNYMIVVFVLCLLNLIVPIVFYPFAVFWFGLAIILSAISSRIILTIIFFGVVTPIAFIRKMLGRDDMKMKLFKKDKLSAMKSRDHWYIADDFLHTF